MENLATVILAAGKGTRMKQELPKVLSKTSEKTLIEHVLDQAKSVNAKKNIVIAGYQAKKVIEKSLSYSKEIGLNTDTCIQENQLGTGDAVKSALPKLEGFSGNILILYGDVPLIKTETLKNLLSIHEEEKATVSILSLKGHYNNSYGRIIRDTNKEVIAIREYKDLKNAERLGDETNSGILVVDSAFLKPAIDGLEPKNTQNEYYLTDIVEKAQSEGQRVVAYPTFDATEIQGVNTLFDLANINKCLQGERINEFIQNGVIFDCVNSVTVDPSVKIEVGARIGRNVYLLGNTTIGKDTHIEMSSMIINSTIGENNLVKIGSRIEDSTIKDNCFLGPFFNIRPGSNLGSNVKIGNFVETKKAIIGEDSKVNHLSYVGDAEVGNNVNIGAGTITCNYDGKEKHLTKINDNVFVGSNSTLVAPLTIEKDAYVGAGTLVNKKTVPSNSLAVSRAEYKTIDNWANKKK